MDQDQEQKYIALILVQQHMMEQQPQPKYRWDIRKNTGVYRPFRISCFVEWDWDWEKDNDQLIARAFWIEDKWDINVVQQKLVLAEDRTSPTIHDMRKWSEKRIRGALLGLLDYLDEEKERLVVELSMEVEASQANISKFLDSL